MNQEERLEYWKTEEKMAHIHGWDFSHIAGRYEEEEDLPWDYKKIIETYLKPSDNLLDIDTGGGEFLLTLAHPYGNTSATEAYPPNVELCREQLSPLGIHFYEAQDYACLPFQDESFDIVINRHGTFDVPELNRILKPGGLFITQQVGEWNDRELVELLLPDCPPSFPGWNLENNILNFRQNGFVILQREEVFRPIRFYDVGALVWFARIIEWEFVGFSVENCWKRLEEARKILVEKGVIEGQIHRFLLVAQKK